MYLIFIFFILSMAKQLQSNKHFEPHFENIFRYEDEYYRSHFQVSKIYWNVNFDKLQKDVNPKYLIFKDGNISNYTKFDLIGHGAFSQVFIGMDSQKQLVVMKELKPIKPIAINREIQILKALKGSRNTVQLVDAIRSQSKRQNATLIYQYTANHNLQSLMKELDLGQIRHYMFQLLIALDETHSRGIMHRDVKLANIIVSQENLTLIDWGLSEFYHPKKRYNTKVGTRYYKAPELLVNNQYYDYSIDMWAFGCTLSSLVFQKHPLFKGKDNYEQLDKIVKLLGSQDLQEYIEEYDIDFHSVPLHTKKSMKLLIKQSNQHLINDEVIDLLEKIFVNSKGSNATPILYVKLQTIFIKIMKQFKFYNGNLIPQIGYGTYQLKGQDCVNGVNYAISIGYQHIDTASIYKNGNSIRVPVRENIYITSKIAPQEQGYKQTIEACQKILKDLDTTYLDLLLIHWPGCAGHKPEDPKNAEIRLESYKALEYLKQQGLVKDIGVSNFLKHHLSHLLEHCKIKPVLDQIEVHPIGWDVETVEFCQQQDILVEAYSPLARNDVRLMKDPFLLNLAQIKKKSIAQISLRWAIQHGFIVIPKSKNPERIKENLEIFDFELSEAEIKQIDKLNQGITTCWNPRTVKF